MNILETFKEGIDKIMKYVPNLYNAAKSLFDNINGPIGAYLLFILLIGMIMLVIRIINGTFGNGQ